MLSSSLNWIHSNGSRVPCLARQVPGAPGLSGWECLTRQGWGVFFEAGFGGGVVDGEVHANDVEGAGIDEVFGAVAEFS